MYSKGEHNLTQGTFEQTIVYTETYEKSTFAIAVGVDITIVSKK